jgi:hypothetical protein
VQAFASVIIAPAELAGGKPNLPFPVNDISAGAAASWLKILLNTNNFCCDALDKRQQTPARVLT